MALKITKASDALAIEQLLLVVYSPPGLGKTSLGFTAESPLLLDFDAGAYRSANRGDSVQVKSWSDISGITADDLTPYKTIVVDTAGRALDSLTAAIIADNPKAGRGGSLTLQGYGELKTRFTSWTKQMRSFGLDIILLAHSDEKQQGDDIIERLDVQGGSKGEIYKAADVMGRLSIQGGKRLLNFSPTDTAFGKNPAQLPIITVPSYTDVPQFFAGVIASTKAALNKHAELQKKAAEMLAAWTQKIEAAEDMDALNALIPVASEENELIRDNAKRMLVKAGKDKGFLFNAKTKVFSEKEKEAA